MSTKIKILIAVLITISVIAKSQIVTDIDGNIYNTITIGSQLWMKENLKTTHYANGDPIPCVMHDQVWAALNTGAYCYNINYNDSGKKYGLLYNYHCGVDSRNLCPTGWKIPDQVDWDLVETTLGKDSVAAKLKSITPDWVNDGPSKPEYANGFSALPAGFRVCRKCETTVTYDENLNPTYHECENPYYVNFSNIGTSAVYLSATEGDEFTIHSNSEIRQRTGTNNNYGLSVRCIKSEAVSVLKANQDEQITVYPNPAINYIYLRKIKGKALVNIFNSQGQIMSENQLTPEKNQINISTYYAGVYLIRISTKKKIFSQTFIKSNY